MYDFRKIIFAVIVAVLLSVFVFATIEAVYPTPENNCYQDFKGCLGNDADPLCNSSTPEYIAEQERQQACNDEWNAHYDTYKFIKFCISTVLALIFIIVGMYIPIQRSFHMALASGLLLGGLFVLFFGTVDSWGSLAVQLRPFVIFLELCVVIIVAWKKIDGLREQKTPNKRKSR